MTATIPTPLPPLTAPPGPPVPGSGTERLQQLMTGRFWGLTLPPSCMPPLPEQVQARHWGAWMRLATLLADDAEFMAAVERATWFILDALNGMPAPRVALAADQQRELAASWVGALLMSGFGIDASGWPAHVALQRAVVAVFGVPARQYPALDLIPERATANELVGFERQLFELIGDGQYWDGADFLGAPCGARGLVTALYAETQHHLMAAGITHVTLWRGQRVAAPAGFGLVDPQLAPLSRWTLDYALAAAFAGRHGGPSQVLCAHVPRSRLLPLAGLVPLPHAHQEVVVLGGTADAVWAWTLDDPLALWNAGEAGYWQQVRAATAALGL